MKIVVGVTGASGAIYAKRFIERLKQNSVDFSMVFSENAKKVWEWEIAEPLPKVEMYSNDNLMAPFSSGSSDYSGMVVIPCSMGTLGRIANGTSDNLINRAADVMLKERRPLILVIREMPYNLIHLENMLRLTKAGAIIIPASPSFYNRPREINDLVDTVIDKVFLQLGLKTRFHWRGN